MQYVARLNTDRLRRQLHHAHKAAGGQLPVKRYNLRLCPEEVLRASAPHVKQHWAYQCAFVCIATNTATDCALMEVLASCLHSPYLVKHIGSDALENAYTLLHSLTHHARVASFQAELQVRACGT